AAPPRGRSLPPLGEARVATPPPPRPPPEHRPAPAPQAAPPHAAGMDGGAGGRGAAVPADTDPDADRGDRRDNRVAGAGGDRGGHEPLGQRQALYELAGPQSATQDQRRPGTLRPDASTIEPCGGGVVSGTRGPPAGASGRGA